MERKMDVYYYAVKADSSIRENASAGGIVPVLVKHVLKNGGYVCGAAWEEGLTVRHILTNDLQVATKIYGIKYVESQTEGIYESIRNLLERKECVLFIGTPCHIYELEKFLDRQYENLYLVDFLCHGVTKSEILKKYIKEKFGNEEVKEVLFNDKEIYRWSHSITIKFKNGKIYREAADKDIFLDLYQKGYILNNCCGASCRYNVRKRHSDITLGNLWAIGEIDANEGTDWFDNTGTSLIRINSGKGENLITTIRSELLLLEPIQELYVKRSENLNIPFLFDKQKKEIFAAKIKKISFLRAYDSVVKGKKDIALLGVWNGANYGAMVSAYALYELLEDLGYSVEFIDTVFSYGNRKDEVLKYIIDRCDVSVKYQSIEEMTELNNRFNIFMVGSDQCWNSSLNELYNNAFYLPFVFHNKKKISYATSLGDDRLISNRGLAQLYLREFDAISVREKKSTDLLQNILGKGTVQCLLDPILMRNPMEYIEEAKKCNPMSKEKYCFVYLLDIKRDTLDMVESLVPKQAGMDIVKCLGLDYTNVYDMDITDFRVNISAYEFVSGFVHSEFVITDSYHGMCMAILLNKPFRVIINEGRGRGRFDSLFGILGLQECAVEYGKPDRGKAYGEIIWSEVNKRIAEWKEKSLFWLKQSLNCSKDENFSEHDYLKQQLSKQNRIINSMGDAIRQEMEYIGNPSSSKIIKLMNDVIKRRDIVVFRGGGIHTQKLLELAGKLLKEKEANIVIMDANPGNITVNGEEFLAIEPSDVILRSADSVFISSWRYRSELLKEVNEICENGELESVNIVDIYTALGLDTSQPFWVRNI